MISINRQVRLAARPSGVPKASDWEVTSEPAPVAGLGQFVVAISHLSIDPAMRGWMNAGASYIAPVQVGEVMRAGAIGHVTASEHPGFTVGDYVYGAFGVQDYALSDGKGVSKLDTSLAEPTTYLGAPWLASRRAAAAPIPLTPPEMRTTAPSSSTAIRTSASSSTAIRTSAAAYPARRCPRRS